MYNILKNISILTIVYQISKILAVIGMLFLPDVEPIKVLYTNTSKITYTSITGMITFTTGKELIEILNKAEENERVVIEINSQGGVMLQGMKIVEAMNNTKAVTVCNVGKLAASMAAIIMNNCHYINLNTDTAVIYHMPYIYMSRI
jgi:ATP-dependent protease ClpP protease subunit